MSIWDDASLRIFCCCVCAALGAAFGSFLNCAAWRIAHGESFLKGHSRCPACGHALGALDLIPVLSWLLLRGRCRYCGERVSVRYPLTELAFAALSVAVLLRFDLSVEALRNWVLLCCLFCLSLVDLDSYLIPDGCILAAILAWVLALPFLWNGWADLGLHVLAGLVFGGGLLAVSLLLDRLLGRESLGGGDVKLFFVVGLYLGLVGGLLTMLLACVLGLLFALLRRGKGAPASIEGEEKPESDGKAIPFGPAISLAAVLILLFGQSLIDWYLRLLGI